MSNPIADQITNETPTPSSVAPQAPVSAPVDPYAPTGAWAVDKGPDHFDVVLPSGQRCMMRQLEIFDIIQAGLVDDLDFLQKFLADDSPEDKKETGEDLMHRLAENPEGIQRIMGIAQKVAVKAVIKPALHFGHQSSVSADSIPVERIGFNDLMEIFSKGVDLFGEEIEPFRDEQAASVGHVPDEQAAQLPSI